MQTLSDKTWQPMEPGAGDFLMRHPNSEFNVCVGRATMRHAHFPSFTTQSLGSSQECISHNVREPSQHELLLTRSLHKSRV